MPYSVSGEYFADNTISGITQQQRVNIFSTTEYNNYPNAVKLLPLISNNNNKVKLYTEVNSNISVGDKVFIMYNKYSTDPIQADSIIMDNYIEFSGCTNYIYLQQMQGYEVIEINDQNNEITIDRYYDARFVSKKIYNHYIGKIYMKNINVEGGEIDGTIIENAILNNGINSSIDINLVQAVIFSGSSLYTRYKNKYDGLYISTNSSLNTGTTSSSYKPYIYLKSVITNQEIAPVRSYNTINNNTYGYDYIYNSDIRYSRIDNGNFENCNIAECSIYGGIFKNCTINQCSMYGGVYSNSPISNDSYWYYGIWSGGTFSMDVWYDGIWNDGDFIGKEWRNGTFNNGLFSGSTWLNGLFQGGKMINSYWSGGTFNGGTGLISNSEWYNGTFNNGNMQNCNWYSGTCNGGNILNTIWYNGTFNGGSMDSSYWYNGTCNNGNILNTYWENGLFNNGVFNSNNNLSISGGTFTTGNTFSYWKNGTFKNGAISNSLWSGGTFYNGTIDSGSLWLDGEFKYGNFLDSGWVNGTFKNGIVKNSYFHNVEWHNGIFDGGTLGITLDAIDPLIHWTGGTFNSGVWGNSGSSSYCYWYAGDFYNGYFYNYYNITGCTGGPWQGGFYRGTFHNGYFYGVFWDGVWENGFFFGCNKSNLLTNKTDNNYINTPKVVSRIYGELPLKQSQTTTK